MTERPEVGRNVLILPPEEISATACELSTQLSTRLDCGFTLGAEFIPHITLYLASYSDTRLEELESRLEDFYLATEPFTVRMNGFSNVAEFIFWDMARDLPLQELHERITGLCYLTILVFHWMKYF